MAVIREFNEEQRKDFEDWAATRPLVVQEMIKKFPPNLLYRMKASGCRCTLLSYSEDGTMRVSVTGQYNRVMFSREVFGVKQEDLEECDLPGPGEDLGDTAAEAGYSASDIRTILIPRRTRR